MHNLTLSLPGFPQQSATNEQNFNSMEFMETIQAIFDHLIQENPIGEARKNAGLGVVANEMESWQV